MTWPRSSRTSRLLPGWIWALVTVWAGAAAAQLHNSELPPLTPDAVFPRCTAFALTETGFPDHKHSHYWSAWETPVDRFGRPYGPGSLWSKGEVQDRPGLVIQPESKAFGHFIIRHHPVYKDKDILLYMELLDWAWTEVPPLLGLTATDTLDIVNPNNNDIYLEMTGYGVWRFYKLDGDDCVMQPWPGLQGRTLDGHAAFMLVTDWLLRENFGDSLPRWLHQGLVEYCGEHGQHLVHYMAQFRSDGPVLYSPPIIDAVLATGVDPDLQRDREVYRKACYGAFLMVWELVENRGGLDPLREVLAAVKSGSTLDEAVQRTYGLNLDDLTASLDPAQVGEPGGKNPPRTRPHKEP